MKLKIYRYSPGKDQVHYDTFKVKGRPGMTVLEALFEIQSKFDDSLAFHYSCRGAVCGTCAMLINGVPRLACRTQLTPLIKGELEMDLSPEPYLQQKVSWNPEEEVLIEPLPHFKVIKDLIVDMNTFFEKYRFIEPFFQASDVNPDKERLMDPSDLHELEIYTSCILCAACVASCPVDGKDPEYLGPAALAKLYRFYIDPREKKKNNRLEKADQPYGWWGCQFHGNCRQVCPKGVPPIMAIGQARAELDSKKKTGE